MVLKTKMKKKEIEQIKKFETVGATFIPNEEFFKTYVHENVVQKNFEKENIFTVIKVMENKIVFRSNRSIFTKKGIVELRFPIMKTEILKFFS